jgi:hypothetical protein
MDDGHFGYKKKLIKVTKKNTALNPPKPWHPLEQQYFKSMDDRHFGYITKLTQK